MIRNSLKQLMRKPGKALIFFLLMAAATALLAFAAVSMVEANQRIDAAESQFTTIGTVTQVMEQGDELLHPEMLNFEGANYVNPPETRPYYLARTPEINDNIAHYQVTSNSVHIVEFTALSQGGSPSDLVKIRIEKVHYEMFDDENISSVVWGVSEKYLERRMEPGDEVYITQEWMRYPIVFQVGARYMTNLFYDMSNSIENDLETYDVFNPPYSTQCDPATGEKLPSIFPETEENWGRRCDEITEDFWEPGGLGDAWMEWIKQIQLWDRHWLPVMPTNGLALIPSFHAKEAYVDQGRAITQEEFDSGAKVCMISDIIALNGIRVGDKINLPMSMALYGYQPNSDETFEFSNPFAEFRSLDAQGKPFDVFFEAEYEVVGIYRQLYPSTGELYGEAVIVPSKSITASDEDNVVYCAPMNDWSTSFQIPNGEIAAFNTALHSAVPEAARLEIFYDDNGYEDVMQSLRNARLSAVLLLGVGALAALTVVVLLMYFFVVKERKRTAIERSLGMTKRQCRTSLLAGILALALPAVVLGSGASWLAMNTELPEPAVDSAPVEAEPEVGDLSLDMDMETVYLSRDYSLWAENEHTEADIQLDEPALSVQNVLYFAVPLGMLLAVLLLALGMVNRNLRMEPVLLLGEKGE